MFVAVLHDEHDIIERYLLLCVCCAWLQSTAVSKMEERWKVMYRDVSWWIVMLRERHQHEIIISFRSFPFVPAHFHLSFSSTICPRSPWLTDLWISQQTLSSTTPLHSTHHLIVHSRSHSLIASFIHSFIHTVVICFFSMFSWFVHAFVHSFICCVMKWTRIQSFNHLVDSSTFICLIWHCWIRSCIMMHRCVSYNIVFHHALWWCI